MRSCDLSNPNVLVGCLEKKLTDGFWKYSLNISQVQSLIELAEDALASLSPPSCGIYSVITINRATIGVVFSLVCRLAHSGLSFKKITIFWVLGMPLLGLWF
jgi:hypothetical protein